MKIADSTLTATPSVTPTPPHVELERLGDQIADLSAHLDAATARLLELIREFDERGGWDNGFSSCAAWLTWRTGLDPGGARERVRVARALPALPRISQALARGELSYSKVRALTRVATPETEERLLKIGREGTAQHVERIVRGWRRLDRIAEAKEATRRHRARTLRVYHDEDGMLVVRARLEPEYGAVVKQALEAAREVVYRRRHAQRQRGGMLETLADGFEDAPTVEQQHADALVMLAESALHHGIDPGAPGERYQVVVHVDAEVLANADAPGQSVIENAVGVAAETAQRLGCDASRVVMRHDRNAHITEADARRRTIPPALRRALVHRDRGCRFPGCWVPLGQGHHIKHWAQGGPTTLSNLVLLCRRHHRAVHEEGYGVERLNDGELQFRRPDGDVVPEAPPSAAVPADPMGTLRQRNEAAGLAIHARTSMPGWTGEPLDVAYAISVLHPRAAAPREPFSLPKPERPDPVFSHRPVMNKRFVVTSLVEPEEL